MVCSEGMACFRVDDGPESAEVVILVPGSDDLLV